MTDAATPAPSALPAGWTDDMVRAYLASKDEQTRIGSAQTQIAPLTPLAPLLTGAEAYTLGDASELIATGVATVTDFQLQTTLNTLARAISNAQARFSALYLPLKATIAGATPAPAAAPATPAPASATAAEASSAAAQAAAGGTGGAA